MMEDAALWDCLWRPLFSPWFLFECAFDPSEIVSLLRVLTCLSRSFRQEVHRTWRALGRPYLSHVSLAHAYRTLAFELHQRRMLRTMHGGLAALGVHDVCVAGGYAAWQLERVLDTEAGRDGYPRSVRGTHIWHGRSMRALWMPTAIDIFLHCDDVELPLDVIGRCYQDFMVTLFRDHFESGALACEVVHDVAEEEEVLPLEEDIEEVARDMGLNEHSVSRCVARRASTVAFHPSIIASRHSLFLGRTDAVLAAANLQVFVTRAPPPDVAYDAWVCDSFDLNHCRVVASVTEEGRFAFTASPSALADLSLRRLALTDRSFSNARFSSNTIHRLSKYMERGFTFEGADPPLS